MIVNAYYAPIFHHSTIFTVGLYSTFTVTLCVMVGLNAAVGAYRDPIQASVIAARSRGATGPLQDGSF